MNLYFVLVLHFTSFSCTHPPSLGVVKVVRTSHKGDGAAAEALKNERERKEEIEIVNVY